MDRRTENLERNLSEMDQHEARSSPTRRLLRLAGIVGFVAVLVLSLLPGDLQAPVRTGLPAELEHFAAYLAVACALRGGFAGPGASVWIVSGLAVVACLLELAQGLVPGRVPALADALAGAAGAWVGSLVGARISRWDSGGRDEAGD